MSEKNSKAKEELDPEKEKEEIEKQTRLLKQIQESEDLLKFTLVESIKKKTLYLNEVALKTGVDVEIKNERIENLPLKKYDVITSRAMASLIDLLKYAHPFCSLKTICIFPKGKNYALELAEAHKKWHFKCSIEQSKVSEEGKILIITDIRKKKEKRSAKNFSRRQS